MAHNPNGDWVVNTRDISNNTNQLLGLIASLPPDYDFVEMLPPALPLIINYRLGGVIVRQLTMTYVGADIATITRTV